MPRAIPVRVSSSRSAVRQPEQRNAAVDPVAEPPPHLLGDLGAGILLVDEGLDLRAQRIGPGNELADRMLAHINPPCSVTSISVSGAL